MVLASGPEPGSRLRTRFHRSSDVYASLVHVKSAGEGKRLFTGIVWKLEESPAILGHALSIWLRFKLTRSLPKYPSFSRRRGTAGSMGHLRKI
ncbi:hypothetical protein AVEN_156264-1 [Araneus ventricosus]|uniref:Uncharacterized protein n=1 Tax=Araneus ventricosus TaxID=182803 RepID=A0A4Y2ENS8_ARAVE|nr:hypothetical protein AVEN_156264-1 [Araneus ventricosus]